MKLNHELQIFTRCAHYLNFIEAATSLSMTPSAVGKVINRLENHYQVKLFNRNTRSMTLTQEGQILLQHSMRIIEEMESISLTYQMMSNTIAGNLKISIPHIGHAFYKIFAAFNAAYPNIDMEINLTDTYSDLIQDGYDAVIRFGHVHDSRLVAKKIGHMHMDIVSSPHYLDNTRKLPAMPVFLQYRFPNTGKIETWPENFVQQHRFHQHKTLIINSIEMIKDICIEGKGIAYLPSLLSTPLIRQQQLVVLHSDHHYARDINLVWPYTRQISPKLRALIDFFSAQSEHFIDG